MPKRPRRTITVLMLALIAASPLTTAQAQRATLTLDGVYRYTGNAPSPTATFRLSFNLDRAPTVCGGSIGGSLVCGVTNVRYTNGPLDVMLALGAPPSVLVYDETAGGGFALYQDDLALNRLGFKIGSARLFSGLLGSPTLVDGVYGVTPNEPCSPITGCAYASYAGQSFASGDPIHDPFFDPVSLQSYDPLEWGTITIASSVTATPEPASAALILTGLVGLAVVGRRRSA